jgi:tRNA threonylcarbamoyl adenosine modification protein YeaZ
MRLLAIDTAANLCAACVFDTDGDRELGRQVIDIGKGHAECLMAVIANALESAATDYSDLDAIGVNIGPGSFTGVRVGVAAARGFALALKLPVMGVSTLEALAAEANPQDPGTPVLAAIDARRGEAYVQQFDGGTGEPEVVALGKAAEYAARSKIVTGSAADLLAEIAGSPVPWSVASTAATADIAVFARLAAAVPPSDAKPKPLYLRLPDAKPQTGSAVPRRSG